MKQTSLYALAVAVALLGVAVNCTRPVDLGAREHTGTAGAQAHADAHAVDTDVLLTDASGDREEGGPPCRSVGPVELDGQTVAWAETLVPWMCTHGDRVESIAQETARVGDVGLEAFSQDERNSLDSRGEVYRVSLRTSAGHIRGSVHMGMGTDGHHGEIISLMPVGPPDARALGGHQLEAVMPFIFAVAHFRDQYEQTPHRSGHAGFTGSELGIDVPGLARLPEFANRPRIALDPEFIRVVAQYEARRRRLSEHPVVRPWEHVVPTTILRVSPQLIDWVMDCGCDVRRVSVVIEGRVQVAEPPAVIPPPFCGPRGGLGCRPRPQRRQRR